VHGRLADTSRRVVPERNPKQATFAWVERMHMADHATRHHPRRDRTRIEQRAIDDGSRRRHPATDAGRAHARTLLASSPAASTPQRGDTIPRANPPGCPVVLMLLTSLPRSIRGNTLDLQAALTGVLVRHSHGWFARWLWLGANGGGNGKKIRPRRSLSVPAPVPTIVPRACHREPRMRN